MSSNVTLLIFKGIFFCKEIIKDRDGGVQFMPF